MRKPERREYKERYSAAKSMKFGIPDPKLDRLSAVVGAACDVFFAKKNLITLLHPWKRKGA